MTFDELGLIEPLLQAVRREGYTTPTAIQERAIPSILEGRDVLGCAQTGTGKTAAFALPILQRLSLPRSERQPGRPIRALILAPTRELAAQTEESFRVYGKQMSLRQTVIYGGVKQGPQEKALRSGADILVATPGRLLDLLNQRVLNLSQVEILVLDEADRMLDMGFIHDIRKVIGMIPAKRQTLFFSATMPREIQSLADSLLKNPVEIRVAQPSPAAETVTQSVYFAESHQKATLLAHLLGDPAVTRALVFSRTKHGADRVVNRLSQLSIKAEAIHSDKAQNARMRALENFRSGRTRVLAATDIAARGLDVDDISHVINYDLPGDVETYVHRIGRTGRAGMPGAAISLCCADQRGKWRDMERMLTRKIPVSAPGIELPIAPPPSQSAESRQEKPSQAASATQATRSARSAAKATGRGRSGSPEQQKNSFWRSKQKTNRSATAADKRPARRRQSTH